MRQNALSQKTGSVKVSKREKEPLVSIIITNYNYGRYLGKAIESVLEQTYLKFELIIVDDGSTDDSRKIIEVFHENYPKKIIPIYKTNGGQASAFNAGFKISSGEIISFLDSDDFWAPLRLEKVVEAFMEGEYSVVQHNMEIVDENSQGRGKLYKKRLFSGNAKKVLLDFCFLDLFVPTSGVCFKRSALEEILPMPENWLICADAYLTRTALFYGSLYSFERPLGFYRIHGKNNFINSDKQNEIDYVKLILEGTNNYLECKGFDERLDFRKNPFYRLSYTGQTPDFLESLKVLKFLLTFPVVGFKEKSKFAFILLKNFFIKLKLFVLNLFKCVS